MQTSTLIIASLADWQTIVTRERAGYHLADQFVRIEVAPTVADVKALHHFAAHTPVAGRKLVVLGFADQLRPEVANALLKLLEEPPVYLQLLLISETARLLPTLRSRVQLNETGLQAGEAWQTALSRYDSTSPADAAKLQHVLRLLVLNHPGVNQELLKPLL